LGRIRIIAMLAALFALAAGLTACGGGGGGGGAGADPQEVIQSATLQGVESGKVDLSVKISSRGESGGDLTASLSGPFQSQAGQELPQVDMSLAVKGTANGEPVNFEGGLTLLSDRAYVGFQGTEYEVDPTTFGYVKSNFEQGQQAAPEESEAGGSKACQEAVAGLDLTNLIDNAANEGSADVDGQETTKVSGDLNVAATADALIELSEDPACGSQLQAAGPLPLDELEKAKDELTGAVKKAHADVYVGEDGIVRRLVLELVVDPKGEGRISADVDLTLSEVNEEQEIAAPSGAEPLEGLFKNLGVNPLELFENAGSGGVVGLLEGLMQGRAGGESGGGSGGGSSGGEPNLPGGAELEKQQAYLECLQEAGTASDLQKCADLAP